MWLLNPYRFAAAYDTDAAAYIAAVEAADGQTLETGVKDAINAFVIGCKSDGIWTAIKASCIMAGARTLAGALVPLVGTAPTRFGTEGGWNYNRKTGLQGNGTDNYLNSNRNNNADPQNSKHLAVYFGAVLSSASAISRVHLGIASQAGQIGASVVGTDPTSAVVDAGRYRANGATAAIVASGLAVGLKGVSRSSSSQIITRQSAANTTTTSASETPLTGNLFVFARNFPGGLPEIDGYSNARLAFYSIGESLNLALLDARVTRLVQEIEFSLNTGLSGAGYDIDTLRYVNAGYAAGGTLA